MNKDKFYLPWNLDSRGRVYPRIDPIEMQKLYLSDLESTPFECLSCGKQTTRQGTKKQPCIHCGTLHDIQGTFFSGYDTVVLSEEIA